MGQSLVSPTRIYATTEAHKCYDLLCGRRQTEDNKENRNIIFTDTVQAFYCAAVVGHLLQRGKRHEVNEKAAKDQLILRQQHWDQREKADLKKALTFLVNIEYKVTDEDEVLQVVAELAEVGIRHIRDKVTETGEYDWVGEINRLRKKTESRN